MNAITPVWHLMPVDETTVSRLQQNLGIDAALCRLLIQRGISTPESAKQFFQFNFDDLHHPFLMKDMDVAVNRLERAVQQGEKILLYGDYDVDGTTSVAMMYSFLHRFHPNLDYYLPDRDKEGYGVSMAGIEYARNHDCRLIIAMDCGIRAHEAIAQAKLWKIDVIVCDHHLPDDTLPAAIACLDPKRPDCPYPYKELSGCGIAFKLAQAYALQNNTPSHELAFLLDLVAVSTACDIVSMTGENRLLTHFGLRRLAQSPRLGLWALIQQANRPKPLNINDLVFGLGPLINAAGRLGDAREAVRLLLSTDKTHAQHQASLLARHNAQRRSMDQQAFKTAQQQFESLPDYEARKSIVLFNPDWHKGIIGIIASRMSEAYNKPAIILTLSNGRAVGSARSIPGFDLYAALDACQQHFITFGGHAHAAGIQMSPENLTKLINDFEQVSQAMTLAGMENPVLEIASKISLDQITPEFWQQLKKFEPFGPDNRNPIFWAENVENTEKTKVLNNNHVRFSLRQNEHSGVWTGIGFNLGHQYLDLSENVFDIVFSIAEEEWQGKRGLTLLIKGVRAAKK